MKKYLLAIACLITCVSSLLAHPPDRVTIVQDCDTQLSQLRIDIEDGQVALSDVFRAVSRFNGYDDRELQWRVPRGRVPINSRRARWSMAAINRTLRPCVNVKEDNSQLAITIDRKSARNWVNSCKADVRWAYDQLDCRSQSTGYGIEMISLTHKYDKRDIVLIVHGLNSRPEDVSAFYKLIEQADLVAAALRYPNDQPIDESSRFLADELEKLSKSYPDRKIRLLTHSMGGLVARGVVETSLNTRNVSQLIMIAPPNHGSALAPVAMFMDCYECVTSPDYHRSQALIESVSDGLGEATADLTPNSVFLDGLNQRSRNPDVEYTILLGTDGQMSEKEMVTLREQIRRLTQRSTFTRFAASKLNRTLEQLDELVAGKGDGVVSCQRGKLEGVDDIVTLPFSHTSILRPESDGSKEAHAVIASRLARK